ncbi:hypothetical protein CY35_15G042500 [Sphagnum magellanicum]|nr:hypothetical protein CY35_15G042500 [Sphagnum magellanicum]KAH9539121.1 hypothetical protein CY35_15G042500 [Sphagnum magellanicum]
MLTRNLQGTSNTCLSQCGNITIPYPFGISPGCGLPEFSLNCTSDAGSNFSANPALLLPPPCGPSGNFCQVTSISANTLIIDATNLISRSCNQNVGSVNATSAYLGPASAPYVFTTQNNLFAWGCSAWGALYDGDEPVGNCSVDCDGTSQNEITYCQYFECCTTPQFPTGVRDITIYGGGYCAQASVIYPPTYWGVVEGGQLQAEWGVQLGWAIPGPSCQNATTLGNYSCAATATCQDAQFGLTGYTCACSAGYDGDGYANGIGCHDINECLNSTLNNCSENAECTNTNGSYYCNCTNGFSGDGSRDGTGCQSIRKRKHLLVAGLSTATAILVGLVLALLCCIKRTRKHKQFARRNFEALGKLQDLFTSLTDGESNTTTLFSLKELEKATNGFADDQKLGVGGFGTVYKGTMESGLNVAVKRTNQLDTSGAHQFLNEVALLSQVNHRNLVRLHGCCLETEVPMLVYEYVPNGNLSEHLRGEKSSELEHLTWPKRMQIAIETAEALTYLHSEANPPIYHRDVKSSNILLNNTYGVKVSDFGISKLIPQDATHVSTIAQGTPGYWDPEYFLSYQLTDKSDVYSFGVILLELITSQPPVDLNRDKMEMSLVAMCIPQIKEGNFEAIVDPKLLSSNFEEIQTTLQEIEKVATLAMHCLAFKGNDRPSMKQVTEVLHQIKGRNCQWSEGGRNMSSEFGLVGVHEIKSIQELELVQLMDANTPNSSQSSNTLSHSSHSNNSSSPCVRK